MTVEAGVITRLFANGAPPLKSEHHPIRFLKDRMNEHRDSFDSVKPALRALRLLASIAAILVATKKFRAGNNSK